MEKFNTHLTNFGLRPISVQSCLYFYMPMKGAASYVVLGTQLFAPEIYEKFSFMLIPNYISLTNACLANSLIGAGLHLYSSRHLMKVETYGRVIFSAFGSAMFNLGSVLGFALCRNTFFGDVPSSDYFNIFCRASVGVICTCTSLGIAYYYIKIIDHAHPANVKKE